jgi:hypothetical protein
VIVNAVRSDALAGARVTQAELRRGLVAAGLPTDRTTLRGLVEEADDHTRRLTLEARLRKELVAIGRPVLDLPFLPEGVDLGGLYALAGRMADAGVRTP